MTAINFPGEGALQVIPNNLMQFHENNAIISSIKEYTGTILSIANTINAPIERLEISGASSQPVTVQGKNLLDLSLLNGSYTGTNCVVTIANGHVVITPTVGSTGESFHIKIPYGRSLPAGTYTFKINDKTNTSLGTYPTLSFLTKLASGSNEVEYSSRTVTFAESWTLTGLRVYFRTSGTTAITAGQFNEYWNIQIELGVAATAYTPFVPDSPSQYYPSSIINVVNPIVTITDNFTALTKNLIGTLRSLPNGVKDRLIIDKSTQTAWIERNIGTISLSSGTSWNIANAKANSLYRSTNLVSGTLTGTTLTSAVTVPTSFEVNYELAIPTTENITYPSIATIQYLTNISTNSNLNPTIKAKVRVLGN